MVAELYVTPIAIDVERERRLDELLADSRRILDEALAEHTAGYDVTARCLLYSGGNDSTVLAHMLRDAVDTAVHVNTTIGIKATRQFVRDTCAGWSLPLLEVKPPVSYRDLVIERGFPGPGQHFKMYQRLKERALRDVRRRYVTDGRQQRVVFIAGRRRTESTRRTERVIPAHERVDSVVWVSPLVNWSALDLNTYRRRYDVPRNPVADLLHMSGECLCGSFAKPGELDEIGMWFPEVRAEIQALEQEVVAVGHPAERCRWGWGADRKVRPSRSGPMCSSCAVPLFDLDVA